MSLTNNETKVLASLRTNVEGGIWIKGGISWKEVYLDNARLPNMSVREFDGTLGSLQKKGFYYDNGGYCFGLVRIED